MQQSPPSSWLLVHTFTCGRSAPRPVLRAPDLIWSNQGPHLTVVTDHALVGVRQLPGAFQLGVGHFRRLSAVNSWKTSGDVFPVTEGKSNVPPRQRHGGLVHLHRRVRGHPNRCSYSFWLPDQQGDTCDSKLTLDMKNSEAATSERRSFFTPRYRRPWLCLQTGLRCRRTLRSESLQRNHTTFLFWNGRKIKGLIGSYDSCQRFHVIGNSFHSGICVQTCRSGFDVWGFTELRGYGQV